MKRRNQFVPSVERLEQLFLLATINQNVANFAGNLVYDSSGTTPHTVYGFPGMSFTVQANCPTIQWTGYQSVTYTSSSNILASGPQVSDGTDGRPRQRTQYDTTIGIAIPFSTWTTTAAPGFYTNTQDQQLFSLPKDNSSYTMTISVDIVAYQYVMGGVPPTDTFHDQLTIIVEPITLNPTSGTSGIVLPSLLITDASGPTEAAFPLWFGTTQASDPSTIDPNGINLSFMMAGGTTTIPFTRKGAG